MGSNAERLSQARKLVGSDPMSRYLGLELVELDEARAVTKYRPTEDHLTALKRVQGGAIFLRLITPLQWPPAHWAVLL